MSPLFLAIEVGVVVFFGLAAWAALRRGRLPFLELLSAAAFGLLLEEGDQLIFQTYHYAPDWLLVVDRAPIAIGLTWALIIAGAMRITDALGVRRRYAPFSDALLAISLDFAFDAVAIRLGLWTWVGIGPDQGWFGVPIANFYAWLWVTFAFSLLSRWVRDGAADRPRLGWLQVGVPIPAFGILLAAIAVFAVLKPLTDPAPGGGGGLFLLNLLAFVAIAGWGVWGPDRGRPDGAAEAMLDLRLSFAVRLAIHLLFLVALIVADIAAQLPVLLAVALLLLSAELPLARLALGRTAAPPAVRPRPSAELP